MRIKNDLRFPVTLVLAVSLYGCGSGSDSDFPGEDFEVDGSFAATETASIDEGGFIVVESLSPVVVDLESNQTDTEQSVQLPEAIVTPVVPSGLESVVTDIAPEPSVAAANSVVESAASVEQPEPVPEQVAPEPVVSQEPAAPVEQPEPVPEQVAPEPVVSQEPAAPVVAADSRNVIVGTNAGDAQCIHLGNEQLGLGSVSDSDWQRWLPSMTFSVGEEFLAVERQSSGSTALRQQYVPSHRGTERVISGSKLANHRTYRLTQSFFFEPGFDWGGRHEGGKLGYGFGGGTAPTGGTVDPAGFTSRLKWRGDNDGTGRIVIYSYAADRPGVFGEDFRYGDVKIPVGEWFTVVMEVTANSATNVSDGSMRGWINGELVLEEYNVGWQQAGGTPIVDSVYYSSFYGGNDTSWSPDHTTYVKVRDVCWSPVVDGYSGIDPDAGRTVVASTQSPDATFADDSFDNTTLSEWQNRKFTLNQVAEESLVAIRTVVPAASADAEPRFRRAIAELASVVESVDSITGNGLGKNPNSSLRIADAEMGTLLLDTTLTEFEIDEIVEIRQLLVKGAVESAELAISVVENALEDSNCFDEITASMECAESIGILAELDSEFSGLLFGLLASDSNTFNISEAIWNRAVDALNNLTREN